MIKHEEQLLTIIRKSIEHDHYYIIFKDNVHYQFENFNNCDEVAKFFNDILKNWHFNIHDDVLIFDVEKVTCPRYTNYSIRIYTRIYLREIFNSDNFNMRVDSITLKEDEKLTNKKFRIYKPVYKESPNCYFIYKNEKGYYD